MGRHDLNYRLFFTHRRMIRDLLVEIVGAPWVDRIDFDSGELVSGSLVHPRQKSREIDILWKFRCKDGKGEVYIHLEHQSRPDPTMPVRLMGYDGLLYQRLLAERVVSVRNKLPLILPIVFYNGVRSWKGATELGSLIGDLDLSAEAYRPQLRFLLVDQKRFPRERLEALDSPVADLFRLEMSRNWDEILANVRRLRENVTDPSLLRAFEGLLQNVILPRFGVPEGAFIQLDLEEFETMLAENIDRWNRRVRAEGRREGRKEGRQEGEARVLLRLLRSKFGPLSREIEKRVRGAESDRLLEWSERTLTADRLQDVLGD